VRLSADAGHKFQSQCVVLTVAPPRVVTTGSILIRESIVDKCNALVTTGKSITCFGHTGVKIEHFQSGESVNTILFRYGHTVNEYLLSATPYMSLAAPVVQERQD